MTEIQPQNKGYAIPRHIVGGSKVLLDEHGVSDAALSYSFVKIDPVRPEWAYLLKLDADKIEVDESIKSVTDVADALTRSLAVRNQDADVSHEIVVREGCLEIYTFLWVYKSLIVFSFSYAILDALEAIFRI